MSQWRYNLKYHFLKLRGKQRWRLLWIGVISALVLTGTLVFFAAIFDNPQTGGGILASSLWWTAAPGFALFFASIVGNLIANAFQKSLDAMPRDALSANKNHHLVKVVGESLRILLLLLAESKPPPEGLAEEDFPQSVADKAKPMFAHMAAVVTQFWQDLVDNKQAEPFKGLYEPALSIFIIDPLARVMDEGTWKQFLNKLHEFAYRDNGSTSKLGDNDLHAAATMLGEQFGRSFRETLKWDFSHDGPGWAAMQLQISGELLKRISAAGEASKQILGALIDLRKAYEDEFKKIKEQIEEHEGASSRRHREMLERLRIQHEEVMEGFKKLERAVHEQGEKTRDVVREVGEKVDDVQATLAKMDNRLAELTKELQQQKINNPNAPTTVSEEDRKILEAIKHNGDLLQQASAAALLGEIDQARDLIRQIDEKNLHGEQSFRYYLTKGDIEYFDGQYDKAIEPYDMASRIMLDDLTARLSLAIAHLGARLGDIAQHKKQASAIFEELLKRFPAGSTDWARAQNNLGLALSTLAMLPTGDKIENLNKAIACYESALEVYTKETYPADWATTQNNLGFALFTLAMLPTGDKTENLKKAIACYESALQVWTKEAYPAEWATTQNNLGLALSTLAMLPTGDKTENLKQARACYEAALEVRTKEAYPADWARLQNNLGYVLSCLPTGDKTENLEQARACYKAALEVRTKEAYPADWAATQNNLGFAWMNLPTGNKTENLNKAIACYEAALEVWTKEAYPAEWAATQNFLGYVRYTLATLLPEDKTENLNKAIACYEAALEVWTKEAYPAEWAKAQSNLGLACYILAILPTGDKTENLKKARACYEAALEVYTKEAYPAEWAMTQNSLGFAWSTLATLPTGDKTENPKNAMACFKAAQEFFTKEAHPGDWEAIQTLIDAIEEELPELK